MDNYFEKIHNLIFKDKYIIRPVHLIDLFGLNIKQAQSLLECFVEKNKNLIAKYGLYGNQDEPNDEIGAKRYILCEKDEIDNSKKHFTKLISCTIKSVKDKDNSHNIFYPGTVNVPKNKEELLDYQKKTFIINKNVNVKKERIENLFLRLDIKKGNNLNQASSSKTNANNLKESIKPIKIEKNSKAKDAFANFKSSTSKPEETKAVNGKQNGAIKKEVDKKEFVKLKNDSSDKKLKEDKKRSRIKKAIDSSEEDLDDESTYNINDIEMNDEEDQIRKSSSQQIKRSKTIDSDSNEDDSNHSKENIKHKNKKQRKRVIEFEDSSDEEEKSNVNRIAVEKSIKEPKEEEPSRLVEEQETYTDEEGYRTTRTIKKIVKEEKKEQAIANNKSTDKKDSKDKKVINKNEKAKKQTETSPSEESKQKKAAKTKQLPKNQASIMSFFKPKNQS